MVNTFLVHVNFIESAKLLDHKRLPNQRREAFQILCHVQRLKAMGDVMGQSLPPDPYCWYAWIREIIKQYRSLSETTNTQLIYHNKQWRLVDNEQLTKLTNIELTIKYGYIYHPAVLMWLGYEDALKEYLDAHIEVSISRGIKNNMIRYQVSNTIRPPWTYDQDFITRHRNVLLAKEIDRQETPWYQNNLLFTQATTHCLYYWPYTPTIGKSASIQGEPDTKHKYMNIDANVIRLPLKITLKIKTKTI
jgi:hypothetical protein